MLAFIGRDSLLWNVFTVLPLTTIIGAGVGLVFWSLNHDDWSIFKKMPRWIFVVVVGLAVVAGVGWYMSGRIIETGLDEHGCVIGEQAWCEVNDVCYVPWEGMCGKGVDADGFNIMKKIKNYYGLDMAPPVQDDFAWFEESGDDVAQVTVSGMVTHFETADTAKLDRAIAKAGMKPDQVNTGLIGSREMRGYRMLQTLVCSLTLSSGESGSSDVTLSCGRINQ